MQFSEKLFSSLKHADRIMVSTGAGVSAESGVPTFRGPGGLWNDFRPEELATPEAFARNPLTVWEWYDWRRTLLKEIKPNPGHFALVELEKLVRGFVLFTQNIDGLHQKAGSSNVYELHGNIWNVRCIKEGKKKSLLQTPLTQLPPVCDCGAFLRPDVVWFGESLPEDTTRLAYQIARTCDVFFLIGSSATVQPAASLAWMAKQNGAFLIEVNPDETDVTEIADASFREKSGTLLPRLVENLRDQ